MSNTRDNGPELDYYELRRRHEEYKNRARMVQPPEETADAVPSERTVPDSRPSAPVAEKPARREAPPLEDLPDETVSVSAPMDADGDAPDDPLARFVEEEPYDDEEVPELEDEDGADVNPNPFDSFIHFFHGVKEGIARRREAKEAELEDLDDLSDEELAALAGDDGEFDEIDEEFEGLDEDGEEMDVPAPRASKKAAVEDVQEALDVESPRPSRREPIETDFSEDGFEDPDDEDWELEEEEDAPSGGGFKKFINLFVTRVDEADEEDEDAQGEEADAEEEEIDGEVKPSRRSRRAAKKKGTDPDSDEFYEDFIRRVHSDTEGGQPMDELNKPVSEPTEQAADVPASETSGMSRRERRERAMRLAAEEAARKAEEEARLAAAAPAAVEPLFDDEPKAETPAIEELPVEEAPAREAAAIEEPVVDEPTREFKPVSMRDAQEAADKGLFDVSDEEDADEDEDNEDEVEEKPRRGLFGRKRASKYDEDDEDEDDEDDDYDEDEDEDDEDEDERPARSRGLFGRRRKSDNEDDDEDEDAEDDEDDYDEDEDEDDYDEYDDDYDEDDEDDEYDNGTHRSFGYHVIGVFKWMLGILLALLIIVIALNFFYSAGHETIVPRMHELMGDSTAFHLLFPSYSVERDLPQADTEPVATAEPTMEPTVAPEPDTTVEIPNLDGSASDDGTVIDVSPQVEAVPYEDSIALPSSGSVLSLIHI